MVIIIGALVPYKYLVSPYTIGIWVLVYSSLLNFNLEIYVRRTGLCGGNQQAKSDFTNDFPICYQDALN